jgi:hypothetical protein
MSQEETRLKVMKGNVPAPSHLAYVVTRSEETRTCYNYGDKGHLSQDCRQPQRLITEEEEAMIGVHRGEVEVMVEEDALEPILLCLRKVLQT